MYQDQFVLGKLVHSGELNRAVPALRALTVQGAVSVMRGLITALSLKLSVFFPNDFGDLSL